MNPGAFTTDVAEFSAALQPAHQATDPSERIQFLQQAIALYGGELLPGFYEEWVLLERERWRMAFGSALRQCSAELQQKGEWEGALDYALRAVAADQEDLEAQEDLIRLYAVLGRNPEAARRYRLLKDRLKHTGQEPPESLRALMQGLATGKPVKTPRSVLASLPSHLPVQPSASAAALPAEPATPHFHAPTLPVMLTAFFGREQEIAQLIALMSANLPDQSPKSDRTSLQPMTAGSRHRLITLTGTGGVGKTRLAVETARHLVDAPACAVTFVSLAGVSDGARRFGWRPALQSHFGCLETAVFHGVLSGPDRRGNGRPTVAALTGQCRSSSWRIYPPLAGATSEPCLSGHVTATARNRR
ncbi:MAG TPA: BTAD domain-containing putative transcriptional regulator [Chthonomonadaceae bacterium]|nr:BTAD domain-containing putative transcriptional regulator [Chthonomonadaceae bacterium]